MPSRFWLISFALLAPIAIAAQNEAISGIVRDNKGEGLSGALVTARTPDGKTGGVARTGANGAYRIDALPTGNYSVSVEMAEFGVVTKSIFAGVSLATTDFVLQPKLKFEASGVRGSIDPGGYSAPAQAAAKSGLMSRMSEMHAADKKIGSSAQSLEACGMFVQASQAYQSLSERDASEDNLFGVGYELMLAGFPNEAAEAFRMARKRLPGSVKIWIGSGAAEFLAGHNGEAIEHLLHAVSLDPLNARAYTFLEKASANSGVQSDRVEAAFKHYAELAPGRADALYDYAVSLIRSRSENLAAIESLLDRAIALDYVFAPAHFQLAALHTSQGDTARAVREYETTVQLAPMMAEAHYRLALAYRQLGQTERADAQLRVFQEMHSVRTAPVTLEEFGGSNKPATVPVRTSCPDSPN